MPYCKQIEAGYNQMSCTITDPFILYHELDGSGTVIRSIALDSGIFELLSVLVAATVFVGIVRWVMGGEKQ